MIKAMNVHFICRGNVFRSLVAETYLKSLNIKDIDVISSGTNVDWDNPQEREYFTNTASLLEKHDIKFFAKSKPDQLTQERLNSNTDIVVFMNQRVISEAEAIITLPQNTLNWEIVDIGEGNRTDTNRRELYEEEIYQEIRRKVNDLFEII
jgi:protein-tyrosine-phosphatase